MMRDRRTTNHHDRTGEQRKITTPVFRIIQGGKKNEPAPIDFSDLRHDVFLRGHYLERNVLGSEKFHPAQ